MAADPTVSRAALASVLAAIADTPVVAINGARQVGKSTLAQQVLKLTHGQLLTLDDGAQRDAANADPRGFVERRTDGPLIIDEVQFAPPLFRALKAAVDRDRRPGRFILTGSTRLLSTAGFADALVGRLEVVELWPFTQGEIAGNTRHNFVDAAFEAPLADSRPSGLTRVDYLERIVAGGFPEAVTRRADRRGAWFTNYLSTLMEKLIRDVSGIERIADLPRIIRLCAARSGEELNVASMANELGLPPRTLDGYLAFLANVFVIQLIPAWSTNLSKKVIRRPKLVIVDSGLAAHLTGTTVRRAEDPTAPIGALLETFVAMELRKQLGWSQQQPTLWHFRDRDGAEVDLVLERPDGTVVGIEVKASSTVSQRDTRGLTFLADRLGDRFHAGYVLSAMPEPTPLGPKLTALPLESLWTPAG
jgi:uncharacterized protein